MKAKEKDASDDTWVVIVTYNAETWVRDCLGSIEAEQRSRCVVVDNASTDDTLQIIEGTFSNVTIISNQQNLGFGIANNRGIQHAISCGASFVLLLNQDVTLDPGCLQNLRQTLAKEPTLGALSAVQLTQNGSELDRTMLDVVPVKCWRDCLLSECQDYYATSFVPASTLLLRTEALLAVGGFDPLFFMYSEDNDLCRRIEAASFGLGVSPKATARHWHGLTSRKRSLRWQLNWDYSRATMLLLAYKGTLPGAFLGVARHWVLPGLGKPLRFFSRFAGLARCLGRYKSIASHRQNVPWSFEAGAGNNSRPEGLSSDALQCDAETAPNTYDA